MFEGYTRNYRSGNLDWTESDKIVGLASWRWAVREDMTVTAEGELDFTGRPRGLPTDDIPNDVNITPIAPLDNTFLRGTRNSV